MTRFTSDIQQGKNFLLHFETDNKEHFLAMQNMARKCIDHNTADVVEVRHGTWYHGTENGAVYAKCSACGRKMNYSCYGYAYCSLCGAKMDGERKENGT